jgi:hypothetical protein
MQIRFFSLSLILALSLSACLPGGNTPTAGSPTLKPTSSLPEATSAPAQDSVSMAGAYPIVDTAQDKCYDNSAEIPCGETFAGQDAQYAGNAPRYRDNGDGTVSDLVTGLMWQQDPGAKMTYPQAVAGADSFNLAGYDDWRLPSIKELYSLILFDGTDVSGCNGTCTATPFIDTRYFNFSYGDTSAGERIIDSQFVSSSKYVSTTMRGDETVFGVNFADGRIKGYGLNDPRGNGQKTFYVLYVRGNPNYGQNDFADNGDGTITDQSTGLTWMQSDSQAWTGNRRSIIANRLILRVPTAGVCPMSKNYTALWITPAPRPPATLQPLTRSSA